MMFNVMKGPYNFETNVFGNFNYDKNYAELCIENYFPEKKSLNLVKTTEKYYSFVGFVYVYCYMFMSVLCCAVEVLFSFFFCI